MPTTDEFASHRWCLVALCAAHALYLLEAQAFPGRWVWLGVLAVYAASCALLGASRLGGLRWLWVLPWAGLLTSYAWPMLQDPLLLPNHHYLLGYTTLAALSSFGWRLEEGRTWAVNCRLLLSLTMGFSTLHKLCSVNFVNGSYFGLMLAKGGFLPLLNSMGGDATTNERAFDALLATNPALDSVVELSVWPGLGFAAVILAWTTLLLELWLTFAMFTRPNHPLTATSWRLFLVVLAPFRQELVFLCTLAALGLGVYAATDKAEAQKWKWLVAIMAPLCAWHLLG